MKILAVDDSPVALDLIRSGLERQPYVILSAQTGEEALSVATRERPDVVLLDVMMPGLSGYDVCQRLRQDPVVSDVTIILLTALQDRESRLRGFEVGADDFLSKPVDSTELRFRLRTLAKLNRFQKRLQERSQYEDLARWSPQGIVSLGRKGLALTGNPKAVELLGDLRARPLLTMFAKEDRAVVKEMWDKLESGEAPLVVFPAMLSGPEGLTPSEVTIRRASYGDQSTVAVMLVSDRTEAVMTAARLERADRLASLAEASGGIAHDFAEAAKWYRKAAEGGDLDAAFTLGMLFDKGHGVQKSSTEAAKWVEKAATSGDPEAQNYLGELYSRGIAGLPNPTNAAVWYRKSAEQGFAEAQANLASLYARGSGVEKIGRAHV